MVEEVEEIMDEEENKSLTAPELADQLLEKIQNRLYLPNLRIRIIYCDAIYPGRLLSPFIQICYDNCVGADYRSLWHRLKTPVSADTWNKAMENLKLKFEEKGKSDSLYFAETIEQYKTLIHIGKLYDYGD